MAGGLDTGLLTGKPVVAKAKVGATTSSSIFNMTNMIIGAGVLALPYAFRAAGLVPAVLICVSVWMASTYSFMLLARCAEALNRFSYKEVAVETYGPFAANFSEGAILLYTLGNLIGRQIILGDLLPPFVQFFFGEEAVFAQRGSVMGFVTCVVLIPVSMSPYIDSLKWSSLFGLLCMCYVVVLFVIHFMVGSFVTHTIDPNDARLAHGSFLAMMAFPLLVVSFTAHYNTMDMYWELKDRSIRKMQTVIKTSTGICLFAYILIGVAGYMLFMDGTKPNILVNFWMDRSKPPTLWTGLAFGAISLAVSFSFPLVCHGARNSVVKLFLHNPYYYQRGGGGVAGIAAADEEQPHQAPSSFCCEGAACGGGDQRQQACITVVIIILSFIVGLLVPDIGVVFAFMGSTVGVCFVYILPALFYLRLHATMGTTREQHTIMDYGFKRKGSSSSSERADALSEPPSRAIALLVFGVLIGIMGTMATSLHFAGFF